MLQSVFDAYSEKKSYREILKTSGESASLVALWDTWKDVRVLERLLWDVWTWKQENEIFHVQMAEKLL